MLVTLIVAMPISIVLSRTLVVGPLLASSLLKISVFGRSIALPTSWLAWFIVCLCWTSLSPLLVFTFLAGLDSDHLSFFGVLHTLSVTSSEDCAWDFAVADWCHYRKLLDAQIDLRFPPRTPA
ncbi:hypothetical protein PR048_012557 [Dryococelus australis]|uniref:Uncharacterized protein n=1 Tax=Dryococelus australis TaxID=614101 RepID=A0ABQ9HPV7_9NEOP|nr:hypothetical protein PR048_012557 [Dryococelus australis]